MDWLASNRRNGEAKRLIPKLSDPAQHDFAARDLVRLGVEAVPALLEALQSPDPDLSPAVRQVLTRIGHPAGPQLIAALNTSHPLVRAQVAEVLGKAQDRSAVPALLDALHGRYFTVRAAAASALGQIGDAQAVDSLAGALKDGEAQVRSSAAMALASYNRPSTFDDIADLLLDDPEIEVRQAAARALGGTANPAALPHLMEALHDSFWWYERENSAVDLLNAIESMGATAVPSLIDALQENEGTLRRFGANLLGRLRDARAVEPLGMTLYDLHHDVGNAAAEALGWFGTAALDVLAEALNHPEAGIRQHGIHGLSRIRDDRVLPLLIKMLRDPERGVRKSALQAVIELRDRRALPALEEIAADRSDRELSSMAKQALLEL